MISISVRVSVGEGLPVETVAKDMIALAKRLGCTVQGYKGTVRLWATPEDDDPQRIVDYYLSVVRRA